MAGRPNHSIMTSYITLVPSLVGITSETKKALKKIAEQASDMMADGFRQAADQGGQDMIQAFRTAAQRSQQNFQDAFDSVSFNTSGILSDLNHVSQQTQDALNHAFNSVNLPVNRIAQQAQQGMNHGLGNLSIDRHDITQQLQQAMQAGIQNVNINLPQAEIADQFETAAGVGIQNVTINLPIAAMAAQFGLALQHGLTASTISLPSASISTQVQQAFQNGLNGVTIPPNAIPQAPLTQQTQAPVQQGATAGITQGITAAGPKIAGLIGALGIGALIGKSIGDGLEIQQSQAKLTASLGLDKAQSDIANAASKNLFLGNYGEGLEEVNQAVIATVSSFRDLGNSQTDIENLTKRALNLASVFETDVNRTLQVSSSLVTSGFAVDAVNAMDLMQAGMSKVPSALREDITDALDEYSPFLAQMGLSGEKGIQLLINASAKGTYGIDKFGDAIKEAQIRMSDMSAASKISYETIGLNQEEMSRKLVQGGEVSAEAFQTIINGLVGLEDPLAQQTAAIGLFGGPLEDLSAHDIPAFLASLQTVPGALGDISGAAAAMDEQLANTASGSIEKLKRQLFMTFGEAMIPIIKELEPQLKDLTKWITENADGIQMWVRDITDTFRSTLVPAFEYIMPYIQEFFQWISDHKFDIMSYIPLIIKFGAVVAGLSIINGIVGIITSLVTGIWGVASALMGAAFAGATFSLSIGWIVLLVAAVAALAVGIGILIADLITDFDGTIDRIVLTAKFVGVALTNIVIGLANGLTGVFNGLSHTLNWVIEGINNILGLIPGLSSNTITWRSEIGGYMSFMDWPQMATGGDVMGPTRLIAGEKEPETIVNRGLMNELMEGVLSGRIGTGNNDDARPITIINNIEKGVADNDETLARNIAVATQTALGANWLQKRA